MIKKYDFKEDDIIEFCEEKYVVIENNGHSGNVFHFSEIEKNERHYICPFIWEIADSKCVKIGRIIKWPELIKNKARCRKCGDIIESTYRHDYVSCKCGEISVDGGLDYRKIRFNDEENFINESIYSNIKIDWGNK